jgi:GNAT superfamily N-acetyltransferase
MAFVTQKPAEGGILNASSPSAGIGPNPTDEMLTTTFAERPDLAARTSEIPSVWPEFMQHDEVVERYWLRLRTELPQFQLVLYDEDWDAVVGEGRTVPFRWDGLPEGLDDVLVRGFASDGRPTALSACVAIVSPDRRGEGLSRLLIEGMRDIARRHKLKTFVAPVRPTMKGRYPLTPMERYVQWTGDDGMPFDPWIRVHIRCGAEVLGVCERSMVISGTVATWEQWTDMSFPDSGSYVVEGGLVPITIDREADRGEYLEPNVWMRHPVD